MFWLVVCAKLIWTVNPQSLKSNNIYLEHMFNIQFVIWTWLIYHFFKMWDSCVSGLKVNFHKSMLTGININASWLSEAALVLNCRVGMLPFVYLGLPIGGDACRLEFWQPVLNRIRTRLSSWNNKFLSFGGCLIILKSVMSSLPVYFLSFFKTPTGIISSIESLFKRFFLGGWRRF